jgi:hypothetical protein
MEMEQLTSFILFSSIMLPSFYSSLCVGEGIFFWLVAHGRGRHPQGIFLVLLRGGKLPVECHQEIQVWEIDHVSTANEFGFLFGTFFGFGRPRVSFVARSVQ